MKYKSGNSFIQILDGVNFSISKGESVALIGPSGSGKTTLLQIAALLDSPSSGNVIINSKDTNNLDDNEKTKLRRKNLGFVYQFHNLLPEFSALENIMIPQIINGVPKKDAEKKALELLEQVELSHRIHHLPKMLSGGEQQRVAIARALANTPQIIIADEPTGNLDPHSADVVFSLFLQLVKQNHIALFMATHNMSLALELNKSIKLVHGKVE